MEKLRDKIEKALYEAYCEGALSQGSHQKEAIEKILNKYFPQ